MANKYQEIMVNYLPEWMREGDEAQRNREWCEAIGEWFDTYPQAELVDFYKNINPEECSIEQLQLLADLIGLTLDQSTTTEEESLRRQLRQAIDWYKIKGTFRSADVIAYSLGFNIQVIGLWSSDYSYFVRFPRVWLDAKELESTGGHPLFFDTGLYLDESLLMNEFFKTPHVDVIIAGDRYRTFDTVDSIFRDIDLESLNNKMDDILPSQAVPHYFLELTCLTDERKVSYEDVTTKVQTTTTNDWLRLLPLLDDGFKLDEGLVLDQTPLFFLEGITKFKLGQGNVGVTPVATMTDLANAIYTGDIKSTDIQTDKITFEIEVDNSINLDNITEIGLFNEALDTLYAISTFPTIQKQGEYTLVVSFEVLFGEIL